MNEVPTITLAGSSLLNMYLSSFHFPLCIQNIIWCYPNICSTNDAEKEDIYQLGVILLQVITGKLITSSSEVEELKYEVYMIFHSYLDILRLYVLSM